VLDTGNVQAKFESFGLHTQSIDGHDINAILDAIDRVKSVKGKPSIIIANTIKGKGISYMEGKSQWHGKTPNDEEFTAAFAELHAKEKELEA
jgi:transketolase